jgi:alkylation response protein AidB-like acyl-CoA dehydrogenase
MTTLRERVQPLLPRIREAADGIERDRRIPDDIIEGLREAGVFSAWLPRELHGDELGLVEAYEALEEIAEADASTGWVATITMGTTPSSCGRSRRRASARSFRAEA